MAGSVFNPTGAEQLFLELLNSARANPVAYGQSIGLDLSGVAASQPLAFNLALVQAARLHSEDMNSRNYFAHVSPDGLDPGDRIDAAGYTGDCVNSSGQHVACAWGESIAAGYDSPAEALKALIIDDGVPDLGHRQHLLAIDSISASTPEVGVGIVLNGSGDFSHYYTIDTARNFLPDSPHNAILTGVIYTDTDHNNLYSPGEGYGSVTVQASSGAGTFSTSTFDSGGYSLPLPAGTYTVTVSGGTFPGSQSASVTIGSSNLKLDFLPSGPIGGGSGGPPSASDELGVWSGAWQLDTNANNAWDGTAGGDSVFRFGSRSTDVPVAIDWNGDGRDELAVFRRGRTLLVDANGNHRWDGIGPDKDAQLTLGGGHEQIIVGDWTGDGRDQVGVLHTRTGMFQLDTNADRVLNAADPQFQFLPLQRGDIAIAGDWAGSGHFDVGIFRGGNTFLLDSNGNHQWDDPALGGASVDTKIVLPVTAAKPAPADYDGDGRSDVAVFSGGTFQIDTDHDGALDAVRPFALGRYPTPGNWA